MQLVSALESQQLVELLAVVSSCRDEATAVRSATERAAETLEAEAACVTVGDTLVHAVGFPASSGGGQGLTTLASGRSQLILPGYGVCAAATADLGGGIGGRLSVVRFDPGDFSVADLNLVRGMAQVLGMTVKMLRTLEMAQSRERLMNHLYRVQRAIARRLPLDEALRLILEGVKDCLSGDGKNVTVVNLYLRADEPGAEMRLVMSRPADFRPPAGARVVSAPVYAAGEPAGSLEICAAGGTEFTTRDIEDLRAFAENASLALTDARTVRAVHDAMHDPLTGMANRVLFLGALRDALSGVGDSAGEGGYSAVLFIDLDKFKQVNDTLGHAAGDELLTTVADRIRRIVRPTDVPARFGGDEFAVLLRHLGDPEAEARQIAHRIIEALTRPVPVTGGTARIGASVGVAYGLVGSEPEDLLRQADTAMYRAKRAGRGRCVVHGDDGAGAALMAVGPA
jgi:diguanylate cyclase (GGDEF)-like protein